MKCAVHAAAGLLVGVCAAYNLTASCFRRDRHLRVNALVYSLAVAYEVRQTLHHLNAINRCADEAHEEIQPAA